VTARSRIVPRGARFAAALALAACGGQVATEADGGTDAAIDTGKLDTGVDTGAEVVVPPRSPGTCTGGGTSISCGPGPTCSSASGPLARTDGAGPPAGRPCGVVLCDVTCTCSSAKESTCNCPVAVAGPQVPPDFEIVGLA